MVPGPSFYIYGGGRWREVDVSSGRIDGWGSARFAYTKRGKVHLAKSKHVLSALRNLKIGRKGAVSDGCRLPFKKLDASNNHRDNQTDTRTCECNYSHCCQRFSHRCPAKNTINHQSVAQNSLIKVSEIKVLTKSDAAIQASPPDSNKKSDKKMFNKNTSSDDDVPSKITTTALNSSPNKLAKLKLKKQWSIAGSDKPQSENTPSLKLNKTDASKYIFYKRKRTDSESSAWVVMPKTDTKLINNAKDHANKSKHLGMRSQSTSSQTSQDSRSQKVVRTKSIVDMKPKPQDMKTNDSYAEAKSKLKRRRLSTTSQSSIESQPQKIVRRTKSIDVKSKSQNVKNNIDHADAKSKQLKMRRQSISSKSSQDSVPQKIVRRTKSVADTHPHNHAKKMKYTPKPIKDQDKVTEKYVTISGDDDIDHADAKSKQLKKRRQSISSKSSQESVPQKIVRRTKSVADTDAQNHAKKIKYAPKPIKDQDKVTEKHFTISDDDVVSDIDHVDDKSKQLKKRRQSISSKSSQESVPQKIVRRTKSVAETHPYHHVKKMKYAPKPIKDQDKVTEKHVTSSEEDLVSEETEAGKLNLNIEQEDVEVFRNYLLHNASDFDLLKFDSSNGYKKKLFYSINPTVNLERCSMIARMMQNDRRDSQSEISLKDFASQLGLTSITEKKVPQRYKLRKRNSDKDTDRSENESEIENKVNKDVVKHSSRKRQTISTDLETDIDSEEDITTNTRSKVAQALPRRYTRSQSTGDRKDNNRKSDLTGKFSSKRKASKSDGDYTDEETSIEEPKTRTKPKRNTRNHLINQAENKKDNNRKSDAKETSAKRKTSKSDGDFTDDDYSVKEVKTKTKPKRNTRNQSAGDRKEREEREERIGDRNPKSVTKSTSSKQKTSKSDGDYTDEDSSVEEDKTRVLRKRRGISNVDHTNISDSKDFQKSSNRSKINNSIKKSKVNTMDLTKSSNDDSDCTTDTEEMTKNQKAKFDKRNNIDTDTSNEDKKMRSPKQSIKERRKSFIKRDTRQSDKQNEEDFNKQNTKLSRERNSRGQFKSLKKIATNDKNDSVDDNSKTTRKSDKNVTKTTNKSQTAVNSEDAFKSKVKDKTKNKLNKTKEETNKDNSHKINMLQSEGDSADEFETYQKEKSKKRNKNISRENDRNNNMTDNDELSETELTKQTKTRSNKPMTNKVDSINDNSNESESSKKKASKSVSGNKKDNTDQVFFAPRIDEVKSLAGKTKVSRPQSSASSMQRVEYSNLEDHAIVSWISLGGRARCVNGNRIWRELQDQYQNLTGQPRTWHSLRNRYLRSILPRLGSMALNPSLVTRLRAAAATGEIKPQKGAPRRNSIFGAPVVGALSRKVRARSSSTEEELPAKRHKHDHTRKQPLPSTRELRPTQEFSPVKSLSSPRYSEITRNFAQKHRKSTPNNSSEIENTEETSIDTKKPNKTSLETRKSVKNSLDAKNVSKTLTDSESPAKKTLVLRSKRQISNDSSSSKSERISSTNRSPEKKMSETEIRRRSVRNLSSVQATAKEQTRTRKLFNPNSMI